jgi:hypothetical protein
MEQRKNFTTILLEQFAFYWFLSAYAFDNVLNLMW